ncbi:AsmA family protein [Roseomonas xinghualingensis]|uniref:AsmA family protein n=1 Tax=Roseomonas xinghualingensis TaxID=2986475 RepID=UPI0021F199EA|nr:AsmA family protein [Roseomonas sp. SXEYE001]MCV4207694.1 AsmA family protein [Roseomonas sp. SXEYE001]
MTEPARPGLLRRLRPWLIGLGGLVIGLPLLGYGALWAVLRTDAIRPRLQAAVEAATGRSFTLSGPVGLSPSLVPTITLEGPVLANAPGGSRPEMLRAKRIEAEMALVPLLSRQVQLRRLTLVEPDLLLEIDAQGRGNWQLGPSAKPEAVAPQPASPSEPSQPVALAVERVTIEGGRVTWRAPGQEEVVELPRLTLRSSDQAILAEGQVVARGVAATVNGGTGPLAALLEDRPGEWPFRAGLSAPGLNAEASGIVALPFQGDGWRVRAAATADTATRLAPFLPGTTLPDAKGLSLVAELDGTNGIRSLHASITEAAIQLAGRPLVIGPAQFAATAPDAPSTLTGTARLGDLPLSVAAQGPTLAAARGPGPLPLTLSLEGGGLAATLRGALAPGRQVTGTEWAVSLRAADLRALGAKTGTAGLPALHDASADGTLRILPEGMDLRDLRLTSREAAGQATLLWRNGAVPRATLRAAMERVDADALMAAPTAAQPPAPALSPAPTPQAPAAPAARSDGRVIPDMPVDLSAIRDAALAADVETSVATLRARGADWRGVTLRAVLEDKKLRVERFTATTPGGPVSGALSAEADGAVPRLSLTLRSGEGGVDPAPLLAAFGTRSPVTGRGALDLSLRGEGAGTRALAASLGGHLGLAMTGGKIDQRLLAGATSALRGVVPENAMGGAADIRCLALRFDLERGVAQSRALLVQTGVATVPGGGAANLGDETLAFRLRPVIRVGDVSVTTPLGITGRFGDPRVTVDQTAAAAAAAGVLGGLARRSEDQDTAAIGALVEGLLGGRGGAAPNVDCAGQLAVARGSAPAVGTPPAPAPAPAAQAPAQAPRQPAVQDLLRGLLGR